jgi:hypothetical protein
MLWNIHAGRRGHQGFLGSNVIDVAATAQRIPIWGLSLENKGALPCIPLQASYRDEKQSLTRIWLHVISLATHSQSYATIFRFSFFKFQFQVSVSCHAVPSSPLHNPPFARTHLGSVWFRVLYFHSIIMWAAVFLSVVASKVVLIDQEDQAG